MAGSIYIATSEVQSGKSLITLGLIELALHKASKAGIFSPIILQRGSAVQRDDHLDQIFSHFNLNLDFKDCFVFTRDESADLVDHRKIDELIEIVISRYKHVEDQCEFVLNEPVQRESGTVAIGPVLQGPSKPVSELSSGCNYYNHSITEIQFT